MSNDILILFQLKFAEIRGNLLRDKQIKVTFNPWLTKTFSENCKSLETYELDLKDYVTKTYVHPSASNKVKQYTVLYEKFKVEDLFTFI